MITGINHITIAVSDLERSLDFYINTLGCKGHIKWDEGAYLTIGDLWLCLSCDEPCLKDDYSHIAFDISPTDYEAFCSGIESRGIKQWKENKSEGMSFYMLDPDGHKLEIHVGDLNTRLEAIKHKPYSGLVYL